MNVGFGFNAAAAQATGTPSDTATSGRGGVVFVPQGVYRIKSTLNIPAGVPEVEGATLAQLPGTVLYKKPATGQVVQAGNVVYGLNP